MIEYLSVDDIRDLHELALERYGGLAGEIEPGMIEFMAGKPQMETADGQEFYPGLFLKAAIYWEGFAARQFFQDGNKRTGYLCGAAFLELNGHAFSVTDADLYDESMRIANHEITLEELVNWIEEHAQVESVDTPFCTE